VPAYTFLGPDFQHNYYAARHWLNGGDPYDGHFGAPIEARFSYAPAVLPLFAWCDFFSAPVALRVWFVALASLVGMGAWASWRTRQQLGLAAVPFPLMLAAALLATPVLFALERGNYDLLVLGLILLAARALRGCSLPRDVVAGMAVALAIWIKVYPGLVLIGLVALGRYRALLCCGLAALVIGLLDVGHLAAFVANLQTLAHEGAPAAQGVIHDSVHSLTGCWHMTWLVRQYPSLAAIPGAAVWACLALPLVAWVTLTVRRQPSNPALLYPFLAWLTAVATFLPTVSNDYNLGVLVLAALAVWDRRDPVLVHVLLGLLLLWWQPVRLTIGAEVLLIFKCLGVVAVGISLVERARSCARPPVLSAACRYSPATGRLAGGFVPSSP
jgi:hypothetical protein